MSSITTYGMMTAVENATDMSYASGPSPITVHFSSQPRGTLYIKNQTTGAEKRISLSNLASGSVVWTPAADDPTIGVETEWEFTVEFAGKADNLEIRSQSNRVVNFDGNGAAELSGKLATAA